MPSVRKRIELGQRASPRRWPRRRPRATGHGPAARPRLWRTGSGAGRRPRAPPPDAADVRAGIERLVRVARRSALRRSRDLDEHFVLLYERLQGREPTNEELFLLRSLHEEAHLTRGMSLSFPLRGREPLPTWAQCRAVHARMGEEQLVSDPERALKAQRIASVPIDPFVMAVINATQCVESAPPARPEPQPVRYEAGVEYQVYYGYLHAHTGFSDGEGTPFDAYTRARDIEPRLLRGDRARRAAAPVAVGREVAAHAAHRRLAQRAGRVRDAGRLRVEPPPARPRERDRLRGLHRDPLALQDARPLRLGRSAPRGLRALQRPRLFGRARHRVPASWTRRIPRDAR